MGLGIVLDLIQRIGTRRGPAGLFQEERAKPRFVSWVAGLFIHPLGSEYLDEPGIGGDCGESPATGEQMSQHSEWLPIPDHLPSGAGEVKTTGTVCPDGTMAVFVRYFRSTSGRFDITRTSGWFDLVLSVSVGRVQEGQLDGSKTVRILPVTPDGAGGYAVIVRTDDGWLGVSSDGLTEDDSDRILSDLIPRLTVETSSIRGEGRGDSAAAIGDDFFKEDFYQATCVKPVPNVMTRPLDHAKSV